MADTKLTKATTTAKAPKQTQLPVKEETEKKAAQVKADTKKEEVKAKTEVKAEEKAPAVKPAAKRGRKPGTKNSTAKKTTTRTTTTRKTTKKETVDEKTEVFVQFAGQEYAERNIMRKVEAAWEAEGKKISAIKKAKLYVKPEDKKAYYVINEGLKNGSTGVIEL